MPDPTILQPGQKFANGRFVLIRPLGRGGMGEVWLARDGRLQEEVALKFLPPEIRGDLAALDDLRRETSRSHKLSHPNIVRIHDLHEEEGGLAFIIMEYVAGLTLADVRVQKPGRVFTWEELQPLMEQLCAALDYAHGERVIHRDLKPANMMLDGRGRLKLADFGIAAVVSDSMSRVSVKHTTSGTLPYMSPQQLTGKPSRPADDIYALGATFYELLTSKPPFYTGDLTHQVLQVTPEPMEDRLTELELVNNIPADVGALVMACLAKEPAQRPQSARAVAEWIGLEIARKSASGNAAQTIPAQEAFAPTDAPMDPPPPLETEATGPRRRMVRWTVGMVVALLAVGATAWHFKRHHVEDPRAQSSSVGSANTMPTASVTSFALARQSAVPLTGGLPETIWQVSDSDGEHYYFQFQPGGILNYEAGRGLRPNGRWEQDGTNVSININNGFSVLSGTIAGGRMQGSAVSHNGKTWTWTATPKS